MTKISLGALHNREKRIFYLYRTYLLEELFNDSKESINSLEFEFNTDQKYFIKKILENIELFESHIIKHLPKDWKWERFNQLEKAILLNATAEVFLVKVKKAIIIDESINFAKKYCGEKAQPLINAIIDKIEAE